MPHGRALANESSVDKVVCPADLIEEGEVAVGLLAGKAPLYEHWNCVFGKGGAERFPACVYLVHDELVEQVVELMIDAKEEYMFDHQLVRLLEVLDRGGFVGIKNCYLLFNFSDSFWPEFQP